MNDSVWMEMFAQERPYSEEQSLDCGQFGPVPQATNVCQCSQTQKCGYGVGVPEEQQNS